MHTASFVYYNNIAFSTLSLFPLKQDKNLKNAHHTNVRLYHCLDTLQASKKFYALNGLANNGLLAFFF